MRMPARSPTLALASRPRFSPGTLLSHFTSEFSLAMKAAGVRLLLPGGLGVRGMATVFQRDTESGVGFMLQMMTVAIAIAIGLLLAQLVLPEHMFARTARRQVDKTTLKSEMETEK